MRDSTLRTPLFYAVYHNNFEMVSLLLHSGAETLFSDVYDRSVLHYACIIGVSKNILKLLIDYNEEMNQSDTHLEEATSAVMKRKPN